MYEHSIAVCMNGLNISMLQICPLFVHGEIFKKKKKREREKRAQRVVVTKSGGNPITNSHYRHPSTQRSRG